MDIAGTKARHRALGEGIVVAFDMPSDIIILSFPEVGEKRYCASFVLEKGIITLESGQAEVAFRLSAYREVVHQQEQRRLQRAAEQARQKPEAKGKRKEKA